MFSDTKVNHRNFYEEKTKVEDKKITLAVEKQPEIIMKEKSSIVSMIKKKVTKKKK